MTNCSYIVEMREINVGVVSKDNEGRISRTSGVFMKR